MSPTLMDAIVYFHVQLSKNISNTNALHFIKEKTRKEEYCWKWEVGTMSISTSELSSYKMGEKHG